jgi:hypothetical protein
MQSWHNYRVGIGRGLGIGLGILVVQELGCLPFIELIKLGIHPSGVSITALVSAGTKAGMGLDLDNWIEKVRRCEYLLEDELKQLCEYVSTSLSCLTAAS